MKSVRKWRNEIGEKKEERELEEKTRRGKESHIKMKTFSNLLSNSVPWSLQQPRLIALVNSFPDVLQS